MAFMMKKKKYKFTVELCLEEITAVTFLNGVLFAKVRLLDGGNFMETSSREEIQDHKVRWGAKFEFVCKMSANASTGVLDPCMLRISVRKELKGGRSFQKLGFTDLNLAEFAGSGHTQRKCLLEGYDTRHRQDNSMLSVTIRMNMLSGDILFKVPSPSVKHKTANSETGPTEETVERRDDFSGGSIASASSGFSSLTKKRPALFNSELLAGNEGVEESTPDAPPVVPVDEGLELGHSRNSSSTSQMSRGSGYGSLQSQHSRQSSSGDSGHIRSPSWPVWAPRLGPLPSPPSPPSETTSPPLPATSTPTRFWNSPLLKHKQTFSPTSPPTTSPTSPTTPKNPPGFRFPPWSGPSPRATSSPGLLSPSPPLIPSAPLPSHPPFDTDQRNNCVSGLSETGSLDRGKAALERRKKAAEEGMGGSGRVETTRVNPDSLIDQLIRATNLEHNDETAETSGLQLFIAKDGTTALGSQEVKSQMSTGVFKQVVIEENR